MVLVFGEFIVRIGGIEIYNLVCKKDGRKMFGFREYKMRDLGFKG